MDSQKTFNTDGELYDEILTAESEEAIYYLFGRIVGFVTKYGAISILDIIMMVDAPMPKNAMYANTHGWVKYDVSKFMVKEVNGKFTIYLGNPRLLIDDEKENSRELKGETK